MFFINADGKKPAKDTLVRLGNEVCKHLNAEEGNDTFTSVEETSFFWIPRGAVWSDIIGFDAALSALFQETGQPYDGYYEAHMGTIHSYFNPGTFGIDLAKKLYAPVDELHPSLRAVPAPDQDATMEQQSDMFSLDNTDDENEDND